MIILEDVTKTYSSGVPALNGINLHVQKGEFVFIVGKSGSGKSTLIKLLLKELDPTTGKIYVNKKYLNKMENLFTRFWKVPIWIGTICTLMAGITIFFAIKYYGESVKSKEELKEDIAKEMQSKNLIWIEKGEFNKLNENMKIIKLWSEDAKFGVIDHLDSV